MYHSERFDPGTHFIYVGGIMCSSGVVLNRTVVDNDWCFDNLGGSRLQILGELYHDQLMVFKLTLINEHDMIGQIQLNLHHPATLALLSGQ